MADPADGTSSTSKRRRGWTGDVLFAEPDEPEAYARLLAQCQCTLAEIGAALAVRFSMPVDDADAFVVSRAEALVTEAWAGRAAMRLQMWRTAFGDPELARNATTTTLAAAVMIGRQHLGYQTDGTDATIRAKVEKVEREAAAMARVSGGTRLRAIRGEK